MMATSLLGARFNRTHAAGVTRYQVDREHRDFGYFECVAIRGVSGTHHFIGSIQVFSVADIERGLEDEDCREAHDGTPSLGPFAEKAVRS
jgi:hypothetical protein